MPVNEQSSKKKQQIWASLILGLALIICSVVVSAGFIRIKGYGRTVSVTGAAYKEITSNYAVWEGNISVTAPTMAAASAELKNSRSLTERFLEREEIPPDIIEFQPVNICKIYDRERVLTGYSLNQTVKVEMADVGRITRLARSASVLIEQGVEFNSRPPQYLFTGLDSLKLEMIQVATENAKLRAERLAHTTDRSVGAPTSARVGIFQIRPRHSQDVSGMGISDVSSVEKEIVSTAHISFILE
ncbi:MAG: SIMPL domain-containing protein [candidate division Zixibacteria bacterium]|nr:SIMPL domain-containing protein [candidate division Zixibacteria bacterium]